MTTLFPVSIRLHSVIDNLDERGGCDGEPEISITTVKGSMRTDGDIVHIRYKESSEGGEVDSRITVYPDARVSISRTGAILSDILFAEGEECRTVYSIPPYRFDMTVMTERIKCSLERDRGELAIYYGMNVGGGEKRVRMKLSITPDQRKK